jgi:predicted PurR-regulated permease PerM
MKRASHAHAPIEARPTPPSSAALAVFVLALVTVVALVLHMLASFFSATLLALVLVALSYPLYERAREKTGSAFIASGVVTTLLMVVVILPLILLALAGVQQIVVAVQVTGDGVFAEEIAALLQGRGEVAEGVRAALARFGVEISPRDIAVFVDDSLRSGLSVAYARVSTLASDTIVMLIHLGTMAVLISAFLYYGTELKRFVFDLSPLPDDEEQMIVDRFNEMSRAVFLGNGVASALQGLCGGILFGVFDIGPSVVWGAIITVLAFLPIVGASVIFLPATLYLALKTGIGNATLYLLCNMIYSFVFEYWLKPRLIGNRASLPAVLIFMGILAGIATYGVLGLFLGPLLLTIFLTLVELWRMRYRGVLFPEAVRAPTVE